MIPPTYAVGCNTSEHLYWTPMGNGTVPDIVVFNMDNATHTVAFCGVMTNADEKGRPIYHICNRQ